MWFASTIWLLVGIFAAPVVFLTGAIVIESLTGLVHRADAGMSGPGRCRPCSASRVVRAACHSPSTGTARTPAEVVGATPTDVRADRRRTAATIPASSRAGMETHMPHMAAATW